MMKSRLVAALGITYRVSLGWELDTGYRWIKATPGRDDDLYEFTLGMTYKFWCNKPPETAP